MIPGAADAGGAVRARGGILSGSRRLGCWGAFPDRGTDRRIRTDGRQPLPMVSQAQDAARNGHLVMFPFAGSVAQRNWDRHVVAASSILTHSSPIDGRDATSSASYFAPDSLPDRPEWA